MNFGNSSKRPLTLPPPHTHTHFWKIMLQSVFQNSCPKSFVWRSKICNINFWIENDPPLELFRKFIRCGILTPEETNKLTVQRDDTRLNAFLKELSQKARELFITLKKGYKTLDAVLKDRKQGATAFQCRAEFLDIETNEGWPMHSKEPFWVLWNSRIINCELSDCTSLLVLIWRHICMIMFIIQS